MHTLKMKSDTVEFDVEIRRVPGPHDASGSDRVINQNWDRAMGVAAKIIDGARASLAETLKTSKEVTLEFGLSFGGKTGVVLVEGSVTANIKVSVKW